MEMNKQRKISEKKKKKSIQPDVVIVLMQYHAFVS